MELSAFQVIGPLHPRQLYPIKCILGLDICVSVLFVSWAFVSHLCIFIANVLFNF